MDLVPASGLACQGQPRVTDRPFTTSPDPRFVYRSDGYRRTLEDVLRGLRRREGVVVVTGDPGTGKTTLCRALRQELPPHAFVSMVLDPCLGADDLLVQMLADFGVLPGHDGPPGEGGVPRDRHQLAALLQRFLASLITIDAYALVVIDEAQHLDPRVLEQIRLWSNFETDTAKLLQVVLVGSPDLADLLRRPYMRALDERVARRCVLTRLTRREVAEYIEHRLRVARSLATPPMPGALLRLRDAPIDCGVPAGGLTRSAVGAIATLSGGVPRAINILCDRAIEVGHGRRRIDRGLVRAAARIAPRCAAATSSATLRRPARMAAVALLMAAPAVWAWNSAHVRASISHRPIAAPVDWRAGAMPAGNAASIASTLNATPPQAPPAFRTLAATEGIIVAVAAGSGEERAARVAEQLQASGLPALLHGDGRSHGVVVGPYVGMDEAETAQRILAEQGFGDTRIVASGASRVRAATASAEPRLLSSPGRLSLVLEVGREPRQVVTRQINETTLELETGPVAGPPAALELAPARGIPLLAHVSLQGFTSETADPFARARVSLTGRARTNVRVAGPRVYLDVDLPEPRHRGIGCDHPCRGILVGSRNP